MPGKPTDVRPTGATLYFLPLRARISVKFGPETTTEVTYARVRLAVEDRAGATALGWGETPLSVQWVWPSTRSYSEREEELQAFCVDLARAWAEFDHLGHPLETGHAFQVEVLPKLWQHHNRQRAGREPLPWLAALVCCSAFDLALHDAYGARLDLPVYATYAAQYMNADLAAYLTPAEGSGVSLAGRYPEAFLAHPAARELAA